MRTFRVGLDSYSLNPLHLSAFDLLDWAAAHGAQGVQFSECNLPAGYALDRIFLKELSARAREKQLYLEWGGGEHIPFDLRTWEPRDLLPGNRRAAEQAQILGTRVIRSCSGGLMRWSQKAPPTEDLLAAMGAELKAQRALFEDHGVTLAIELHFEFTTFELLRLFELCAAEPGGFLGICLDTMNCLTMLEDPVAATARVLPWTVATHMKDGALKLDEEGLISYPTEIGAGQIDFLQILGLLASCDREIHLSVEDHGGEFRIPIYQAEFLARFPDLGDGELTRLVQLADARREVKPPPLPRADWPGICRERVARDIAALQTIVAAGGWA